MNTNTNTNIYNICLLGFGNVGQAFLRLLQEKTTELREQYGITWRLTGVATRRLGWLVNAKGLDVPTLLAQPTTRLAQKKQQGQIPRDVRSWLAAAQADVLFELTSLNVENGEPAVSHIRAAFEHGAHVVTANKGPILYGYHELAALARARGRQLLFEATVMGGAPLFSLFRNTLPAAHLRRFRGLLNSTSNVVIEQMELGQSFEDAIRIAQDLGIAETDPSMDVDGWDAAVKASIIAQVLMDAPLTLDKVRRIGIRALSTEQVSAALVAGSPYKLVSTSERTPAGFVATVQPEQIGPSDPLSGASSGSMVAHYELDVLPGLTVKLDVPATGQVGPAVTAYDVLADFIRVSHAKHV
jgi:homoserine dehydrogenase